nr:retrotransposable element Tf2 [Tanacetum cinerariifolium]
PNNANPNNMTPESVQAMIDQALLQNSTNRDGSHSLHEDNRRNVQKIELWNLKVKGNDVPAYTEHFQELTLIYTKFIANETKKTDKYVSGLPDNNYESVKASKPKTLDESIELANEFMDQKLRTYVKIEYQRASGLLQPLDIPVWTWDEISMDFVTRLPRTQKKNDAIWVVVDRLTKSAHFLPIRKDFSISRMADIFQQEIVRLHGTPAAIVSDRDPRFTSRFLKGLQSAWGTRLKFSLTFHPKTNGQTERTIQTLEDMLRSCALEWTGNCDEYLCLLEFLYNNSWHASIKAAPYELLYRRKCRAPIC